MGRGWDAGGNTSISLRKNPNRKSFQNELEGYVFVA